MKHKWLLFLIIPVSAFADTLLMSNITNGCSSGLNDDTYLKATFTRSQYQCNPGYYLPANNDGCMICPEYYDCNGGNFTFNEIDTQGAKFKTFITSDIKNGCRTDFTKSINNTANISPVFTPNVHTCSPGYYLPANINECKKCLNDHYCPGGNLTFNETINQGIMPCSSEHPFAPVGMWQSSQCGRKLHIGNDIIYMHQMPANPTEHRLFIQIGNDIYSANAVPAGNTNIPMSINSTQSLHVSINGIEYLVHDDSVKTQ